MKTIIIGGGASGIATAIRIKQINPEHQVTVLEHLDEILKKIYATGNGRCNITNKKAKHYDEINGFLCSLGLVLREDDDGRMYPYSNQAASVVSILQKQCEKLGVEIITCCNVKSIDNFENTFTVYTDKGQLQADSLVLATGGKSQPALGSDGSGYQLVRGFGHTITSLSPALVQLKSSNKNCRLLKGVRTKCSVKIETNGEIIGEDFGELLFTDYGISGIVVMNLSSLVNDQALANGKERTVAVLDLVPDMTADELRSHYNTFDSFEGILPQKLCAILKKQADDDLDKMVRCIKSWRLIITGTKGYNLAQITKGGVVASELDESNQSALCKGLFVVGELTDNQFPCGGFNLSYAIYSGIRAAEKIAQ